MGFRQSCKLGSLTHRGVPLGARLAVLRNTRPLRHDITATDLAAARLGTNQLVKTRVLHELLHLFALLVELHSLLLNLHDASMKLLDGEGDLGLLIGASQFLLKLGLSLRFLLLFTLSLDVPDFSGLAATVPLCLYDSTLPGIETCEETIVAVDNRLTQSTRAAHLGLDHLSEGLGQA